MQRTKSKILSILLSLVMLLSLLPTTALAATYPDTVRVYNASGAITSLDDGQCLVTNDASATSYTSGAYVARYEKSTGTLYLKDYHGVATDGRILADGDLNIEVEGDSSFTTSLSSATNHLYGIQANGTLTISGSGTLTVSATGKGNVYGIYAKEGVTISAPLAVTVGKNNTEETGPVYGIYTESGAISLSGADKTITATGGKNPAYGVYNEAQTSSAGSSNITISGKLTVNLSNGSINRGISSQGGDITLDGATVKIPGSYYYGIFNNNGNVVIKSTSDVDISSDISGNNGICTYSGGNLTIENSTVKVSAEGYAANLKGNVSIKDSMVDLTRTSSYYEVIKTGNSSAANTIDLSGTGTVTLTASGEQTNNAMITGNVTLVGSTKCEKGRRNGSSYDGVYDGSSKTVLQFVHEVAASTTLKGIDIIINPELKLAVPTAAPNGTATNERSLAAIGIYDDGSVGPVAVTWEFMTPPGPKGVSLDGSTLKVTNKAGAGSFTIKATSTEGSHTDMETVTITKDTPVETAIVATAPTTGTNITIPNGGTTTSGNCSYKVYDQYGAEMAGTTATWKMDPATVTGVTLTASNGSISVNNTATKGTVKLYAESGGVKSNEITFNIARETSVAKSLTIEGSIDSVTVPTVTEPGTTNCAYATYTAIVKDQYGAKMDGQTIEWSFTDKPGVTFNNGQLTVTNKADAGTVTITAKSGALTATKTVNINKDAAKVSIVKITAQDNKPPVTIITCTGSQRLEYYTATAYDQYGKEIQEDVTWSLNPEVSGVSYEVSAINNNSVTLKVAPTAAVGTFKLVATSQTVTTVKGELEIRVQKKTDVSSKINFNDGSLTYNGAGQKYEKAALDSSVTPGTGEKWTYTYAVKSTGMLDAAGLPKTVGTYTVTATYEDSLNIGSKSATLTIEPKTVDIPAEDKMVYTYDGTEKTYNIPTSTYYTVSGNKQTNANEGGYPVTVALTDTTNTTWPGGNTGVQIYYFKIMRATPTGEPAYTKITTSGKTLADAALSVGTINPNAGTLVWVDNAGTVLPNTTPVEANTTYKWRFTPTDTNYKALTGSIELWHKSTSSGGYYYAPTAAVVPDMPMLYRGCTGDAVKTLQDKLNALGYNSGSVDGIFGAKTYAAVTAFQKANSLGVDGIVGKLTWGKLYGVSPAMPVETTTVVGRPMVSYGSRGDAVRKLQELLNALGYDCGSVDGIFGSKTKAAVLAFQKANGLGVDGIVGPLTWAKLG